ncbi:hypothetical protein P3X46_024004 [Hevea brasiliensis]|uniref:C2 domain-containing protein n=1 Tax=Hevea brasiliensis TaxID=3981 RepID=A0ABQ9LGF6_HEVBR|nr:hypothetical protein P3X46_024004 [Hevea brasiliensis]
MDTSTCKPLIMEINLISAQFLGRGRKSSLMQTYLVVHLNRKQMLTSRIDKEGHDSPTWNDKFIFVVDEYGDIFRVRRFVKDKRIGVVRVLLDNLISKDHGCSEGESPKFVAFHVRNPAGEPMGILNIGVAKLNGVFHQEIPKFLSLDFALDHRRLMGSETVARA